MYENDKYIYLVLEYCQGGNLLDYMNSNGPLSEEKATDIIA